jgi:hypothetical protein
MFSKRLLAMILYSSGIALLVLAMATTPVQAYQEGAPDNCFDINENPTGCESPNVYYECWVLDYEGYDTTIDFDGIMWYCNIVGGGGPKNTATPTRIFWTYTPTFTPSSTPTPSATPSPTPTATRTPTATNTPTNSQTPTNTLPPSPSATPTEGCVRRSWPFLDCATFTPTYTPTPPCELINLYGGWGPEICATYTPTPSPTVECVLIQGAFGFTVCHTVTPTPGFLIPDADSDDPNYSNDPWIRWIQQTMPGFPDFPATGIMVVDEVWALIFLIFLVLVTVIVFLGWYSWKPQTWEDLWSYIQYFFSEGFWNMVGGYLGDLWQWYGNTFLDPAGEWLEGAWNTTSNWFEGAGQSIDNWVSSAWDTTENFASNAWDSTTGWFEGAWDSTTNWVEGAWDSTSNWFKGAGKTIKGWFS